MTEFDALMMILVGFFIGRKSPPVAEWRLPQGLKDALRAKARSWASMSSRRGSNHLRPSPVAPHESHHLQQVSRLPSGTYFWVCSCMDDGKAPTFDGAIDAFTEHCMIVHMP